MVTKYKHILFDLDKTIWDFDSNSESTIREIYNFLDLNEKGIESFEEFHNVYEGHNLKLWELYRNDRITEQDLMVRRFRDAMDDFGLKDEEISQMFSTKYLEILPTKTKVFPGTHETLEYLSAKYKLHIITNGFSEVQFTKLRNADMEKYFTHIIISEDAGAKKPDAAIFEYALQKINANAEDCLMIGDDIEVDLLGAKNAGIDQVYFNPNRIGHQEKFTYEIFEMKELIDIL